MLIGRTLREIQITETFLKEVIEGSVWKLVSVKEAIEKSTKRTIRSHQDQLVGFKGDQV